MSTNRIQKLLFSEYCDFEDMVLVESPFAETNREGKGVRQVHLGLTPSKLVLATDILPWAEESSIFFMPGLDPEIETLELVAVYPIDCVNLSVFHRRKRQSLKARFCNNKVMYFELGGFEKRNMFWNLWCEKIKFLSPKDSNFSHSETSVATSTSNSTLYLISSKRYTNGGGSQIWCQYAGGDFARVISNNDPPKWPDKHLYLGAVEDPLKYTPVQLPPSEEDFLKKKCEETQTVTTEKSFTTDLSHGPNIKPIAAINRFSSAVQENCNIGLYLPAESGKIQAPNSLSTCNILLNPSSTQSIDVRCLHALIHNQAYNFIEVANSAVRIWEMQNSRTSLSIRAKHRRRYAFAPQPHFYRGLGPWNVNQGERFTLQMKRAVSMVCIKRQPIEPELRLSVSRRQLIASISYENLYEDRKLLNSSNNNTIRNSHKSPVIFFWTPEYWYRPLSAREAYQELQAHLHKIHEYHQIKDSIKTQFFRNKRKSSESLSTSSGTESESPSQSYLQKVKKTIRKESIMQRITPKRRSYPSSEKMNTDVARKETSVQFLRRILRMEIALSAWDFDSNILAIQLTLIDRDLFVKIVPEELSILLWQQSSKNASNVGALIAFSHRVSSLVTTEILKDDTEKIRARLITRFINVAEKCNSINNFQSCRSVLNGLQSPPIFRLHSTWNYVRKRHSSRYEVFEYLCRLYRDARLPAYQNSFHHASKSPTYMPFIGDIIAKLLDIVPAEEPHRGLSVTPSSSATAGTNNLGLKISVKRKHSHPRTAEPKRIHSKIEQTQSLFKKIISSLKVWHADENVNKKRSNASLLNEVKSSTLDDYRSVADRYKEMYFYEDHRQERLNECMKLLVVHQNAASRYNYPQNDLAREYLLKARYKEDQDNFMLSLTIEPPQQSTMQFVK